MFVVTVLGGLSIENNAGSVPPAARQRRRLSLVALLAVAGERGLSRDRIQSYLWPESDAPRARHALDQLLYTTRRDLGPDVILSSPTDLRLNLAVVQTDIGTFDAAIASSRWEEAVGAYAGPVLNGVHLCDSAELEQWIDAERLHREQARLRALNALSEAATRRGDLHEAVRWRRQQAAADPYSVSPALELMRALEAAGDRPGALHHARVFQNTIRSTLEIEPDPSIATLVRAITARTPQAGEPEASTIAPSASSSREETSRRWNLFPRRASALLFASGGLAAAVMAGSRARQPSPPSGVASTPVADGRSVARDVLAQRSDLTPNPEARSLYLRARALWEKRTKGPLEEAVVLFRQATELDPGYGAAYAGLAQSYAMLGYFGFAPADAMFPKARAAAQRAIALDSTAGDAYAALGQALAWGHAWAEAEVAYERAVALAPTDATAHQWYALLLAYLGRAREAAVHTGHASRLDPLSVQVNNMHGMMLYYAGQPAEALRQYERTVDAEPDSGWVRRNPWVLTNYSRVAAASGQHALAVRLVERSLEVVPSHPRPLFDLAYAHAVAGDADGARRAFARADSSHAHYAVYRALVHGLLGERVEAFEWFDRVSEWPLPSLVSLNCEPRLATLRADPQFERIRARLKMVAP